MAALLIKDSMNNTMDTMGFTAALQSNFYIHQLNHAHWREVNGDGYPAAKPGIDIADWRTAGPPRFAQRDVP